MDTNAADEQHKAWLKARVSDLAQIKVQAEILMGVVGSNAYKDIHHSLVGIAASAMMTAWIEATDGGLRGGKGYDQIRAEAGDLADKIIAKEASDE
jgi:hypothetical protein